MPDNFDQFETSDFDLEALLAEALGADPDNVFEWTEPAAWVLDEDFDE